MKACTQHTYETKHFGWKDFKEVIENACVQIIGMDELEEATKQNLQISYSEWFIKTEFNRKNLMVNVLMHSYTDYEKNLDYYGGEKYLLDFYFPYKKALLKAILEAYPALEGACRYLLKQLRNTETQYMEYLYEGKYGRRNKHSKNRNRNKNYRTQRGHA